ncbi:MAG: TonB-dependent receptor [Sphingobacteriales bacterium]|nr:TonB-dependent receptor [Sphingobacteriales bacterium]
MQSIVTFCINRLSYPAFHKDWIRFIMKVNTLIISVIAFTAQILLAAPGRGQGNEKTVISLSFKNSPIKKIFSTIETKADVVIMYENTGTLKNEKATISVTDKTVADVLNELLKDKGLKWSIRENVIRVEAAAPEEDKSISRSGSPDLILLAPGLELPPPVKGRVTDSAGAPLNGASVKIKGTQTGTTTNARGEFSIDANPGDVLVITFVGYQQKSVTLTQSNNLSIVMTLEQAVSDEVVVVGYSTQKKANLTGAVAVISGKDIAGRQVGQTSMALQGMSPGLTVTQSSGQPGKDGGTIRLRGVGTLGDANPLILVDGVPNDINNVDPNIIESITVLKDAASASIYGTRAANGVILITTKRGSSGKFSINYSGYVGIQKPTDLKRRVNAVDHMTMLNLANTNVGRSPVFEEDYIKNYPSMHASDPTLYPDTDWFKEIYTRNGLTQNHSIDFSGGTDRVKIMGLLGYYDQQGILNNTDFKRYSLRLNSDIKLSSKLNVKADIFIRFMNTAQPGSGTQLVLFSTNHLASIEPTRYSFGYAAPSTGSNPLALLNEGGYDRTNTPSIMPTLGFTYHFIDDLYFDFSFTSNFWEDDRKNFKTITQTYYPNGDLFAPGSQVARLLQSNSRYFQNNTWGTLNYRKTFAEHHFKALLGASQESYNYRWFSASRDNFVLPRNDVINAGGSGNQQTAGAGSDWSLRSLFGRLNYDLKSKYLFEADFRYDGSSRFAEGRKFGFFPSFSAGWRLSQEGFWNNLSTVANELKLRASWGKLGNQNIGTYPYDAFLSSTIFSLNGVNVNGLTPTEMANPDISWETSKMTNLGIDGELWHHLSFSFDYYRKRTEGILLRLDVPSIIGLTAPYQNAGVVDNNGWELSIGYSGRLRDFAYRFSGTLSDVKNKIIDLKGVNVEGLLVNFEGYPMNSFYGYEAIGYFQSADEIASSPKQFGNVIPGGIKYKDLDGNNTIDGNDRKIIGNQIPRYTYSLSGNLNWKNIDLSFLLQGVGKADGYLYGTAIMPFNNGSTALEMHKDYWTPDNPNAAFPSLTFNESNNIQNSSFWVKNASYLRMKNLQIGYTLDESIWGVKGVKKIRIYVSGQNLFTVDKFWNGFDVEAPVGVGDYYPQIKTYSAGININF